jgi:hypothetical protein
MDKSETLSVTGFQMKTPHYIHGQQSRCDAPARVRGGEASVAASRVVNTTMLATLFTAKIAPRWVSGGLPKEGNP